MTDLWIMILKRKAFICALGAFVFLIHDNVMAQKQAFKIMTYNIRHASPPSAPRKIDVDTVAGVIKKYKPDFLALQEVDVHTGRSGKTLNEAQAIAEKTGMHYSFGKAIDFDGGAYGIAVLSKFPIDSSRSVTLPSANAQAERRALQIAFVSIPNGEKLVIACTHMDAEEADDSRLLQIHVIDSILAAMPYPVLFAGDLNAEPQSPVITKLDQHFLRSCIKDCGYSFSSDRPEKTIDYISGRKADGFVFNRHRVLPEAYPSDHFAVMAEVTLPKTKRKAQKR